MFFQDRVSHAVHLLCNRNSAYDETFSLTVIQRYILREVLCLYVDMNVSKWLMMRRARFSQTAMMRRTHLVDEEDSHKRCVNEDGCKIARADEPAATPLAPASCKLAFTTV